jgi:hypothetical protein
VGEIAKKWVKSLKLHSIITLTPGARWSTKFSSVALDEDLLNEYCKESKALFCAHIVCGHREEISFMFKKYK